MRPASGTNGSLSSDHEWLVRETGQVVEPAPRTELGRALDDVASFIRRFVFFKDKPYADVLALWRIAHTWAFEAATVTPYVWLYSPEMGSGKTRPLEVIELLVRAPLRAIEPTEAVLFSEDHDLAGEEHFGCELDGEGRAELRPHRLGEPSVPLHARADDLCLLLG